MRLDWYRLTVTFGDVVLPHVLSIEPVKASYTSEKPVPYRRYNHIVADRSQWRIIRLKGEVRGSLSTIQTSVAAIRGLADNIARTLNLGDGEIGITSKMINPQFEITVENFGDPNDSVLPYSMSFLECRTEHRIVQGYGSSLGKVVNPYIQGYGLSVGQISKPQLSQVVAGYGASASSVAAIRSHPAIGSGLSIAQIATVIRNRYEYYNTGDDDYQLAWGPYQSAQTFTVGENSHAITSVKLKLFKYGAYSQTVTVAIVPTDIDGAPTLASGYLTSGTISPALITSDTAGEWYTIALTEIALLPNTKYAIVLSYVWGDVNHAIFWRLDGSTPTYADGNDYYSIDSGTTWPYIYTTKDFMFEVWGPHL